MRDLDTFEALLAGELDAPDLPARVRALSSLPLVERAACLGALFPALEARRPELRAAAVRALAGANGRPAFRALLRAFDDDDEDVRAAAVETFVASASRQPARWVHALFHPRPDVRRRALAHLPPRSARSLYLLADPESGDAVRAALAGQARPRLGERGLPLLIGLRRSGHLTPAEAALLLGDVEVRDVLAFAATGRARPPDEIDQLLRSLSSAGEPLGSDVLDELLEILLAAAEPGRDALLLRWREGLLGASEPTRRRVAAALIAGGDLSSEAVVTLLITCVPELLGSTALPRPLRRRAATGLLELRPSLPPHPKQQVAALLRALAEDDDGGVDLGIVAGVLRLATPSQIPKLLAATIGEARLITAFLADPLRSAPLLSSRCLPSTARAELLQRIGEREGGRLPELLAVAAWALPSDDSAFLEELGPADAARVALALVRLAERSEVRFSDRKLRHVSDSVGARLVPEGSAAPETAELTRFVRGWLASGAADSELGQRIFSAAVSRLSTERFVALCVALPTDLLERLIPILPFCQGVSFGKELGLAHALRDPPSEAVARFVEERLGDGPSEPTSKPPSGVHELPLAAQQALERCAFAALGAELHKRAGVQTLGIPAALAARPGGEGPSVEACVALLGAHDDPVRVATQIARYASSEVAFLQAFEEAAVATWAHAPGLPLLGAAWLWRWERQAFRFGELATAQPEGLDGLLAFGLGLSWEPLRTSVWFAVARVLALWAARDKTRFWSACGDGHRFADAAVEQLDTELGEPAAAILLVLKHMQAPALAPKLEAIRQKLPDVSEAVAYELRRLLATSGLRFREQGARHHARSVGPADLMAIRASTDLERLTQACGSESEPLVQEAVLRLLELGKEADLAAWMAAHTAAPHLGVLADSLPLWSDAAAVATGRALLSAPAIPAELRFRLALGFVERGDEHELAAAYAAACAPSEATWFKPKDYDKLAALGTPERAALELAASAEPHAYRRAVEALLQGDPPLDDAAVAAALRRFLRQGTERDRELRRRAARWLAERGDAYGFPLLLAEALEEHGSAALKRLWNEPLARVATEGVLTAGQALDVEQDLVRLLASAPIAGRDAALERVLLDAYDEDAAHAAVAALDRRQARAGKLRQIAELFAWGFRTGLLLTGKHHRPHMTADGAYGYVRRNDPRVYVTPLPLLRGDPNGKDVVEGLILHELGHHKWHSGDQNDRVWASAEKIKMHRLLNLVADEHLERNLRALHAPWGDKLKRLAAYAFQHADKEIGVDDLLHVLGSNAFDVLVRCGLQIGHAPDRVRVDSGAVLRALEEQGHPFARFVRALRMGLGNRHDDPLVERALSLFTPSFRKLDMRGLLDVAHRLREIFGHDAALLDSFGGAETVDEGERAKTAASDNLSDAQVQPEVERILDPRKLKDGRGRGGTGGSGKLAINVSGVPHFDKIERVERLVVDPSAERELAREVARPAARLRRFFEELGIQREPVSRRTSGTRLDKSQLPRLVLLGEPRVLTARQPRFETDLFLGVLVDCSGSMEACDNILKARRFAALIAQAARDVPGIDVRLFGFTGDVIYDVGDARRSAAAALSAGGGNNDAAGLLHLAEVAKRSRRRAKVLIMISDGLPTECSTEALRSLVDRLEKREGMLLAQVAVRPLEEQCFRHYVRLDEDDVQLVVGRFGETVARLVRRALR